MIYIIAALDQNRVIGYKGKLPWHIENDLKHFKNLTLNQTLIMGRKTYLSLFINSNDICLYFVTDLKEKMHVFDI